MEQKPELTSMGLLVAATKVASAAWGDEGRKAHISETLLGLFPFLCEGVGEHQPLGGLSFLGLLKAERETYRMYCCSEKDYGQL